MGETLFALVLIFSPTAESYTQETYKRDLPKAVCEAAQAAIWAENWETVGQDENGGIPSVDALCVPMEAAPVETILTFSME